jgi:hypothetical protein
MDSLNNLAIQFTKPLSAMNFFIAIGSPVAESAIMKVGGNNEEQSVHIERRA